MKKLIKLLSVALAAVLACTLLAACGGGKNKEGVGVYTYNSYTSIFPNTWNVHTWETEQDRLPHVYAEMGLYDYERTDDEQGYKWVYEMAAAEPEDVTTKYAGDEVYRVPAGVTEQYAWKIKLNPLAKWANGDVINADTYIESMELLLNHEYKNSRASSFFSGTIILANAKKYFSIGDDLYNTYLDEDGNIDMDYEDAESKDLLLSMTQPVFSGYSFTAIDKVLGGGIFGVDTDGDDKPDVDLLKKYTEIQKATKTEYFKYEESMKDDIEYMYSLALEAFGIFADDLKEEGMWEQYWNSIFYYHYGVIKPFDFSQVGIKKTGDYEIEIITNKPISQFFVKFAFAQNFIVHKPTYEKYSAKVGDLKTTEYGTAVDKYMSYGPYKFDKIQADKEMLFVKNDKWYGYTDGKHEGQYQTTRVKISMITDPNTALQKFQTGEFDTLTLNSTTYKDFRDSDYLLKTDSSATWRFQFNTDAAKVALMEQEGKGTKNVNAKIVLNQKFRKAFSLGIDRITYAKDCTAGEKAAYALLSPQYYYDIENNPDSVYRNTQPAMEAVCKLYGVEYGPDKEYKTLEEAYGKITGYDLNQARKLFKEAWAEAKADGSVDASKGLQLDFLIPAKTETAGLESMRKFIETSLQQVAVGSELEGKVSVTWTYDERAYNEMSQKGGSGKYVVGFCAWNGMQLNPYDYIGLYVDSVTKDINEFGFNPKDEKLTITADFDEDAATAPTEVTRSYYDWHKYLVEKTKEEGGYSNASVELKNEILAGIEYGLLDMAIVCPVTTSSEIELFSKRIKYFTLEYNPFAGYGGIRQMTYEMDDYDWAQYCKQQGTINYK